MPAIVSDTTVLIVLAAQQRLDLLGACFDRILLPDAVYREWLAGDPEVTRQVEALAFLLRKQCKAKTAMNGISCCSTKG